MDDTRFLSIQLMGQFRIEGVDAASPDRLPRRAAELIQLLSLAPQRCLPRDQVLEALWPRLDVDAAAANLRKAAHHARHFIGDAAALLLRGGQVVLLPERRVRCDALAFESAADAALAGDDPAACASASLLYTGELLPAARYEAWAEAPRQRIRDKYLQLLRRAGEHERLAREEPTDEAAHLALMRSELAAGRRTQALRWYAHLREHLRQTLGLRPGADIEAVYRQCVAGVEDHEPVFVGRALELVRLLAAMRGAAAGGCAAALLSAPAGLGKTTLCRRLTREARALGWQVLAVQASDWTRPYGLATDLVEPLLQGADEAAREALGPHARAVLAALTPAAGPRETLALPMGRHQVVGAVRRLLLATAAGRPVLLIVDDAQAADDASAELLAQLAASGPPLFVLLSARPSLPAALAGPVQRMARSQRLVSVELAPLGEDEAVALARACAPQLTAEDCAALARRAEGLPFAVVELARVFRPGEPLPAALSAALGERLCDLGEGEGGMDALRRLALSGDDFEVEAGLALAEDPGSDGPVDGARAAAARLDSALRAGVLVVHEGRYRFRHALMREALAEGIPPHRRGSLHREAAGSLAAVGAAPGRIAQHWFAAGEVERAVPYAIQAARQAFALAAYEDVLRHVAPLLAHRPGHPEALALRAESLDALGRPGTLAAYDEAAAVALPETAHELRAKRALAQVKMSDAPGALKYLRDVHPTTVPGRLAEALAYSGAAALGFGDPAEGSRRAAEVRRIALETGDEGTLVIASWAQAAAAHARGDLHGSVWADLKETSHLPHLALRVFDGHLCITQRFLYGSRPYADVIAFADALATEARRLDAARGHAFAVTLRGEARLLNGHLDAAEADLVAGGRLHRAIGGATGEALSLQRRAELAMYRNQPELAGGLLDEALDVARQSDVGFHLLDRIYGTRIALARRAEAALDVLEEAEAAVRGPLETCPGCRITFAVPATIAAARARETQLAASHLRLSEYLADVVMKLPAWHAALREARAHVAWASGDRNGALRGFAEAAQGFAGAGHPLDEARCRLSARDGVAAR